jgi:hypothetical protein
MRPFFKTLFVIAILVFGSGSVYAAACSSFKTEIKYPDGSVGCLEELPIGRQLINNESLTVIQKIERFPVYVIASGLSDQCKAIVVETTRTPGTLPVPLIPIPELEKIALDKCFNFGCDCQTIVSNGTALVPKEVLMSGRGLETNTANLNKKILAEEKQIKEEASKQAQLEREQREMQEKVRIAQEKKTVEEKRLQLDLAKNSVDAEKARLALDKAKAEETKALAQLAKLEALEKEKADLIAKLQQEKDARDKLTSQQKTDNDKIAALRKELEKEVRVQTVKPNLVSGPATYANRKALVIGNDSYAKVTPLVNAREDAKVMAESLTALGFNVSMKLDVTQKQFLAELRNFKNQVKAGDEVALFYAGHGVQIASTNYLLPIDTQGQNEEEIRDDAISLQRLLDDMDDKKVKFTLAVIDACRDNPFKGTTRSAIGTRGLAPTTAATGQMIVFSAGTGQQALDKVGPNDKSKNGLFTRIFVKEMQKEGLTVDRVVRNVRTEVVAVAKSVGHNQVPAIYDQVVGEFYFKQ